MVRRQPQTRPALAGVVALAIAVIAPAPRALALDAGRTGAPHSADAKPGKVLAAASHALRVSASQGLYLLDPPMAGEPLLDGHVLVEFGGKAPPADTVVEVNGAPMKRYGGAAAKFWRVDTSVTQPTLRRDRTVTITARAGSLESSVTFTCPADIPVATSTPVGTSLGGAGSLVLNWGVDLSTVSTPVADFFASAQLRAVDLATSTLAPGMLAHSGVPRGATQAVLTVPPTNASGYAAEVRWQGAFVHDGSNEGFCGRVKRLVFPQ
jgi:hypothetical protein